MTITSLNQLDLSRGGYTYADYLLWQLKERVELLRGRIFKMSLLLLLSTKESL